MVVRGLDGSGTAGSAPKDSGTSPSTTSQRSEPSAVGATGPACSVNWTELSVIDGPLTPAPVGAGWEGACPSGADTSVLAFRSSAAGSGDQFTAQVLLPSTSENARDVLRDFWVGVWLSQVPCSAEGLGYSEVVLSPPSLNGSSTGTDWTVHVVTWALVAPGGCSAECQNVTAFVTVAAARFCEVALPAPISASWGSSPLAIAPGDQIAVAFRGDPSGGAATAWWVNDTSSESGFLAEPSLGPATGVAIGAPLPPISSNSSATGWTPYDVAVGVDDCPFPVFPSGPACDSYSTSGLGAGGPAPVVESVRFGPPSTPGYPSAYAQVGTWSSSGGCSGEAETDPCTNFTTSGGAGEYPTWQVIENGPGGSAWELVSPSSPALASYGTPAAEYDPSALSVRWSGTTLAVARSLGTNSADADLSLELADPDGVAVVNVTSYWCSAPGSPPGPSNETAALASGPSSTEFLGNWTASVPLNGSNGTLAVRTVAGGSGGGTAAPIYLRTTVTAAGTACSLAPPSAPALSASNVTSTAGGYRIRWAAPASWTQELTLWANSTSSSFSENLTASTGTELTLGVGDVPFDLALVATDVDGRVSSPSTLAAEPTLGVLSAQWGRVPTALTWNSSTAATFAVTNVSGGDAPYSVNVSFGDGNRSESSVTAGNATFVHGFGTFEGAVVVLAWITDAQGSRTTLPLLGYDLAAAAPALVNQSVMGGQGFVVLAWSPPPVLPPGTASCGVLSYVAQISPAYISPSPVPPNGTGPGAPPPLAYLIANGNGSAPWLAWNRTVLFGQVFGPVTVGVVLTLSGDKRVLPEPLGYSVEALSVELTSSDSCDGNISVGLLPSNSSVGEVGVSDPFALTFLTPAPAAGPAPLSANVSAGAEIPNGTAVDYARYLASSGASGLAAVEYAGALYPGVSSWAFWFDLQFPTPGDYYVSLTVVDAVGDYAESSIYVVVTTGPPPPTAASITTSPNYVGTPVGFRASASGTGPFSYAWSFGDGTNGSGSSVLHNYTSPGTYDAVVGVTNETGGGIRNTTLVVVVYALPAVAISTSAGPNGSLSFYFGAIASGGSGSLKITWSFGDGTVANGANVTHAYATPGLYLVNVSATDPSGRGAMASVYVRAVAPATSTSAAGVPEWEAGLLIAAAGVAAFLVGWVLPRRARGREEGSPAPEPTPTEETAGETESGTGDGEPEDEA